MTRNRAPTRDKMLLDKHISVRQSCDSRFTLLAVRYLCTRVPGYLPTSIDIILCPTISVINIINEIILTVILLGIATCVNTEVSESSEEFLRAKRQINSLPLVYPYGGTYKLIIGLSAPIHNSDQVALLFAANMQYQYVQFTNISELSHKGMNGPDCVLRAICEAAQYPVEEEGFVDDESVNQKHVQDDEFVNQEHVQDDDSVNLEHVQDDDLVNQEHVQDDETLIQDQSNVLFVYDEHQLENLIG
ncbi:Uncharacterized protein OBRU01_23269, partial [Operophtera brumata]